MWNKTKLLLKNKKGIIDSFIILKIRLIKKKYSYRMNGKINYKTNSKVNSILLKKFKNEISEMEKKELLSYAEGILRNKIIIFGEKYDFNYKNWDIDLKSGYKWPNFFFNKLELKKERFAADVKFPWEISRLQFLMSLAYAFEITNEKKYLKKYIEILECWIEKNVFNKGINWTVSMEVAIRSVNILQSFLIMQVNLNEDLKKKINHSLYQHYIYIKNNYEKGINTNNHYLSNLCGMIWLSIFFNENSTLRFATKELDKEIKYQINEDGFSYEDSVPYHCLNLEMLLLTIIFMEKNDQEVPKMITDTIVKMSLFLDEIIKRNELIPLIGDMDSGRFLILNDFFRIEKRKFTFLLGVASEFFNLKFNTKLDKSYSKLILKKEKMEIKGKKKSIKKSCFLKKSGLYILKNDVFECIVRCGELGVNGIGGHSHNDQLSFELNIMGQDFFVDSGTGEYTRNYNSRNELRKTAAHNTVGIEKVEQNYFKKKDAFHINSNYTILNTEYNENYFKGCIKYKNEGIQHERKIELYKENMKIRDSVLGIKKGRKYINLILEPKIIYNIKGNCIFLKIKNLVVKINIKNGLSIKSKRIKISNEYGVFLETTNLRIYFEEECELDIKVII